MKLEKFDYEKVSKKLINETGHCYQKDLLNAAHEFYQKQVEGEFKVGDEVYTIFMGVIHLSKITEKRDTITGTEYSGDKFYLKPKSMLYRTKQEAEEALKALEGEDGK